MRLLTTLLVWLLVGQNSMAQKYPLPRWHNMIKPSDTHLKYIIANKSNAFTSVDAVMQQAIQAADQTFSQEELTTIVAICSRYCNTSAVIGDLLTGWLRESHVIYNNRLPSVAGQFRSYLLASLASFPPSEALYKYVKAELLFDGHAFNVAAAAVAARNFSDKAAELLPLMEPYLSAVFTDERVDITTPQLNYPLVHPTKVRYEIINTLLAYGPLAYRSLKWLDAIVACNNCGDYGSDAALCAKATKAAKYIRTVTPACCRKEAAVTTASRGLLLVEPSKRRMVPGNVKLLDQEGQPLQLSDLTGKPFALTFFYTQCTNALKCVATVQRLAALEKACNNNNLTGKMGIYGMTYDPDFDTPAILKKYGEMYGIRFGRDMRFLKTASNNNVSFAGQLQLRVNYGAGSVNQHGIQLFVFDKKGRLAATCDEDLWSVTDVARCLAALVKE